MSSYRGYLGKEALTKATFGVTMSEATRRIKAFHEEAEAAKIGKHAFDADVGFKGCFQCGKSRNHPVHKAQRGGT